MTRNFICQCVGQLSIGNDVLVASDVFIVDFNYGILPYSENYLSNDLNIKNVKVEDGVWISNSVIVLPGVTIGKKSIITAGSVATHSVAPYCMVTGNPARIIKKFDFEGGHGLRLKGMNLEKNIKNRIYNIRNLSVSVKASVVYIFASLLSKGLAIITMPIFTRLMSSEQIGIVNLFNSWQSMLGVVATLSLTSGGYMVAMREYEDQRDEYTSSVLTLTSLMAMFLMIIYEISPSFWNTLTGLPEPLIVLMLLNFFWSPATDFWLARQRYEYKYVAVGLVTVFSSTLASIVSAIIVVLAAQNNMGNLGAIRLFSSYGVTLVVAFLLWGYIMVKGKTYIHKEFWKCSLILSLPLMGNSIAMQVLSVSDRVMISKMLGNGAVGIYGILYTVGSLSLIVWGAINSSFIPYLFENIDKKEGRKSIRKRSTQLMLLYGVIAIIMTLLAPEIILILATEEYYEAIYIMPPIAAGVFLTSISEMHSDVLIYYKKTSYIIISSIIAALINVVLNYIGIRLWGYIAAAYTTLFAYIVLAFIRCMGSRKIYSIKTNNVDKFVYKDRLLFIFSILIIVICLLCSMLYYHTIIRYCIIGSLIIVVIVKRKKLMNFIRIKSDL